MTQTLARPNPEDPTLGQPNRRETGLLLPVIGLIFLLLGPILPLSQLTINNVPKVYLPEDAPAVVIDNEIREYFPSDQGMAFLFENPGLYSDQFLLALDKLTMALRKHPQIERVFGVTRQDHIKVTDDGFLIEALLNVRRLDEWNEDERRERALSDRFVRGALVAEDGGALALIVIPVALDDSFARMSLQTSVHELIEAHGVADRVTAEAGLITTDVEQTREYLQQLTVFMPLTVCVGLLLVWLLFRRALAVVLGLAIIGTTVGPTIALYSLFDLPFNLISSVLPPLLCALTIAALVHLFNGLRLAGRRGLTGHYRVRSALKRSRRPALYSALTTMAGFGALGLSEIRPISHLGFITSAGVALIYVVVYHLLPPVMANLDRSSWDTRRAERGPLDRLIAMLFHTGTRHPVATLAIALLLLGGGAPMLGRIVVETNLLEFFAPGHKTRVATEHFESKLQGTGSLDVLLTTQTPQGLIEPRVLTRIKAFQQWAQAQEEVDRASSAADYVEEMNRAFNGGDAAFRSIPDDASLIAQYLFVYDGTDLYDFINADFEVGRIHLNLNVHGASEINDFLARMNMHLQAQPFPGATWKVAGLGRMFSDQVDLLVRGQLKSILGAIGVIFLLMLLEWRSLRDALVCLLPNLAPVLLIFIMMGVLGIWLDVATAMIASLAAGIAIDDTIHIFHGFLQRYRRGASPVVAIARTYHYAGRAVMTTTIILCAQFAVLLLSDFVPIRHFGLLATTGMFSALVFDLLLLPAILMLVYRRQGTSGDALGR